MSMADWADLDYDLTVSIIEKVNSIEDFVGFGVVCKSWNEAFTKNKTCIRRHPQVPWLMWERTNATENQQQIFILGKEKIFTKNLYVPEMSNKQCIGLNHGWVLTVSQISMNLVHPISRNCKELSQTYDFDNGRQTYPYCLRSAALSANPSESSDFVLMIVHSEGVLSSWDSVLKRWTSVGNYYENVTYYQDQFYAVSYSGEVWGFKFSTGCNIPTRRLVAKIGKDNGDLVGSGWLFFYIVGSEGGLLVVVRQIINMEDLLFKYHVYELDLISGLGYKKKIKRLGDRAIFVGYSSTISLDHASQYPGVLKSDRIYFMHGKTMGSYNLEDGQIEFHMVDQSLTRGYLFWLTPSL